MKANSRILGAVLVGVGTWKTTSYCQGVLKRNHKHATKKLAKEAFQSWEGEGGTIIDPLPRATAN